MDGGALFAQGRCQVSPVTHDARACLDLPQCPERPRRSAGAGVPVRPPEGRRPKERAAQHRRVRPCAAPVGMLEAQPRHGHAERPDGGEPLVVQPIARRPAPGRALGLTVTSPWTESRAFGAGTLIGVRSGSLSLSCGRSSGSPDSRETGPHRGSPTRGDLRVSPATAALGRSHHRPPGASNPPLFACLRPGLSSSVFGLLTVPSVAPTHVSSASGHIPLRAARFKMEFGVSVDGFPEQGRQVA